VSYVLQGIVTGLLTGGIYALMASGLTLTYGIMGIINVAQGILVIMGAYLSYLLSQTLHLDLFAGLLLTVPIMFLLGLLIERAFLRRIKRNRAALSILVLFAVAQVLEGVLSLVFTTNSTNLQGWYIDASFSMGGFYYIPYIYFFAFLLSVVLMVLLFFLVYRTRFGTSLRASIQNPTAALLVGIDVDRVKNITFGIGVALAAVGGMAYGATNAFNPASSYDLISRLLVIVVLGGMGSLSGALLASLIVLVISDITALVWSPVWSSTVFFVLLIVLLLFRPQGLFGQVKGRTQ
jgi:branched-chain amino acid transport system permease protein